MNESSTEIKTTFNHVVLRGTAYEVGVSQANMVKQIPGWVSFFQSGKDVPGRPGMDETLHILREFCPELEEEINGFSDTMHIPAGDLIYIASTHLKPQHCSHLVVLPSLTENGHTLVGRNYDFGETMDDMRLCSTFMKGRYAHIGFSSMLFGRLDGMNEHGLSVTASVGGMPVGLMQGLQPPTGNGLQFWAQVRIILEQCKTVEEAEALFKALPNCSNPILIIADPSGAALVAEGYGEKKTVRRLDGASSEQFAVATNHFMAPEMRPYNPVAMNHSLVRFQTADKWIQSVAPRVNPEKIKELLAGRYPDGLCAHYYKEFFGNLHAMVFDLNERTMQVTFGSPAVNPWHTIRFDDLQPGQYETTLPLEQSSPEFWAPVSL